MKTLARQPIVLAALLLPLVGLGGAATAASVSAVRVGEHAGFTRVVLELDETATYRIERREGDDESELLHVVVDAALAETGSRARASEDSLLESVEWSGLGGQTVARLRLRKAGVEVSETLLERPARIVLDVQGRARRARRAERPPPGRAEAVLAADWLRDPLLAGSSGALMLADEFEIERESEGVETRFVFEREYLGREFGPFDEESALLSDAVRRSYRATSSWELMETGPFLGGRRAGVSLVGSYEGTDEVLSLRYASQRDPLQRLGRQLPSAGMSFDLAGLDLSVDMGFGQQYSFGRYSLRTDDDDDEGGDPGAGFSEQQIRRWRVSAYLPVSRFAGDLAPAWMLPTLSYSLTSVEADIRSLELGESDESQSSRSQLMHYMGASWAGSRWSLAYAYQQLEQVDAQRGVETPYEWTSHDASFDVWPTETLSLFLWGARVSESYGPDTGRRKTSASVGATWRFLPRWTLSSSYSPGLETDQSSRSRTLESTVAAELGYRFRTPLAGGAEDAPRLRLRLARTESGYRDDFGYRSDDEDYVVGVGLVIPLF